MPKESNGLSIFAAAAAASTHCKESAKDFMRMVLQTAEFMLLVIQSLKLFGGCRSLGCAVLRNNN